MDSSRFHILCQDEFLGFEQNDENGENFLGKREKEKLEVRREELGVEGGYWKCEMRMKQPVGRGHLTTPKLWDI